MVFSTSIFRRRSFGTIDGGGFEPQDPFGAGPNFEPVVDSMPDDPRDFARFGHQQGDVIPVPFGDPSVHQKVLDLFCPAESQRAKTVARPPGPAIIV